MKFTRSGKTIINRHAEQSGLAMQEIVELLHWAAVNKKRGADPVALLKAAQAAFYQSRSKVYVDGKEVAFKATPEGTVELETPPTHNADIFIARSNLTWMNS